MRASRGEITIEEILQEAYAVIANTLAGNNNIKLSSSNNWYCSDISCFI